MEMLKGPYFASNISNNDQDFTSQDFGNMLIKITNATDAKAKEFNTSNLGPISGMNNFVFNEFLQVDVKYCGNDHEKASYTIKNRENSLSLSVTDALIKKLMIGNFKNLDIVHFQKVLGIGKQTEI